MPYQAYWLLFFGVTKQVSPTLAEQLRTACFQVVSALSTTGFATVDLQNWNGLGRNNFV